MRKLAVCFLALLGAFPTLAGDNWPQFRGPNGDGLSDSTGLPVTWSETENLRWKTLIHDKGWSSPVIWGDQVWLTTAEEKGHAFYAVCLDRKSGRIVYDLKLATADNPTDISKYNSFASPTPALEEGRAYIHFGTFGTFCLDTKTGKQLWENRELHVDHWRGPASSPVVWRNLLFLTFDGYDKQYVAALDKNSGQIVWRKDRDINYGTDNGDLKKGFSTPSIFEVNGKAQLVSPAAAATIAYDPESGSEIWKVYHGGMNEAMRPIRGHGLIYLNSGHTLSLLAVREGRTGDLTQDGVAWKSPRGASSRPSPLLIGESIYMVNDQGIASCLDAMTGKQVWQERLPRFKDCYASPVSAEGRIYTCDRDDGLTAVFAASRQFKLLAVNKLDTGCTASPAIAGDALFLRTKTHLYCIGK
jgi:outer membrane protein assembly factor BamB